MRVPFLGVRLPRPLPRAPWHQVGLPRGLRVLASAQPALPFSPYHTWLTAYVYLVAFLLCWAGSSVSTATTSAETSAWARRSPPAHGAALGAKPEGLCYGRLLPAAARRHSGTASSAFCRWTWWPQRPPGASVVTGMSQPSFFWGPGPCRTRLLAVMTDVSPPPRHPQQFLPGSCCRAGDHWTFSAPSKAFVRLPLTDGSFRRGLMSRACLGT